MEKKFKGTNSTQPKQLQPEAPPEVITQRTNQFFFKSLTFTKKSTLTKQVVFLRLPEEAKST